MKDSIFFILYKPAVPGNIGASARALKTMGFSRLRLIEPADHLCDEARMMAHASNDILENAQVFSSFEEAVADLDFVIATTAKDRSAKEDYLNSRDLGSFIEHKQGIIKRLGILFGTEESGLPNELILRSNLGLSIPMAGPYPSLNLSQAVMIAAYELSYILPLPPAKEEKIMSDEGWRQLDKRVKALLKESGIKKENPIYHRILERVSYLSSDDARLLHAVSSRLLKKKD